MSISQTPWTKEEESKLVDMYETKTYIEMAKVLNKKVGSVSTKIHAMRKEGLITSFKLKPSQNDHNASIIKMYGQYTIQEIADTIGRSLSFVNLNITKLKKEGLIKVSKNNPWTTDDENVIINMYFEHSNQEIAEVLGRTLSSVIAKIGDMTSIGRLSNSTARTISRVWTEAEDEYLLVNYEKMESRIIAKNIGRSGAAVMARMRKLGITSIKTKQRRRWTDEELQFLVDNYTTMSLVDMACELDRTLCAVNNAVQKHPGCDPSIIVRPWTDDEISIICDMHPNHSNNEIASLLGRSVTSLNSKIFCMLEDNILSAKRVTWSVDSVNKIVEMYSGHTYREMAKELGITPRSLASRINILKREGRLSHAKKQQWTKEEDDVIRQMHDKHNRDVIAEKLDRSYNAVVQRINKLKKEGRL